LDFWEDIVITAIDNLSTEDVDANEVANDEY